MSAYRLAAGDKAFIIRRLTARKWSVRDQNAPDVAYAFFAILFHTLRDARKWANDQLFPGVVRKRIHRKRFKSDPRAVLQAARMIAKGRNRRGSK